MGEVRSGSSPRRIQVRPPSWVIQSSTVAGPLGPRVIHGVLELEPRAVHQQGVGRIRRLRRRRRAAARAGEPSRRRHPGHRRRPGHRRSRRRATGRDWPSRKSSARRRAIRSRAGPDADAATRRRAGPARRQAGVAIPGGRRRPRRAFAPLGGPRPGRGCAVRGGDAGRLGGGSSSTGVKPWPAVIRGWAGPVPEIGSMFGGPRVLGRGSGRPRAGRPSRRAG